MSTLFTRITTSFFKKKKNNSFLSLSYANDFNLLYNTLVLLLPANIYPHNSCYLLQPMTIALFFKIKYLVLNWLFFSKVREIIGFMSSSLLILKHFQFLFIKTNKNSENVLTFALWAPVTCYQFFFFLTIPFTKWPYRGFLLLFWRVYFLFYIGNLGMSLLVNCEFWYSFKEF